MTKILSFLVAVLMSAPSFADITFELAPNSPGEAIQTGGSILTRRVSRVSFPEVNNTSSVAFKIEGGIYSCEIPFSLIEQEKIDLVTLGQAIVEDKIDVTCVIVNTRGSTWVATDFRLDFKGLWSSE